MDMQADASQGRRRVRDAVVAVALGLGAASAFADAPTPATNAETRIAGLWRTTLAEADYKTIVLSYDVLAALNVEGEAAGREACIAQQAALARSLEINPVSLALHKAAADCAEARGDAQASEHHLQEFSSLARHAMAVQLSTSNATQVRVMAEADVLAFIEASGHETLYAYYDIFTPGRRLPLMFATWDADEKRERIFDFDYLEAQMALRRREPHARFAYFRRLFGKSILDEFGKTPGSIAAEAVALRGALTATTPTARMERVESLAREGAFGATMTYVLACAGQRYEACAPKAVDLLLPWAEARTSAALIALAQFQSEGIGVDRDLKAARELLDLADARLGNAQGSVAFAATQIAVRGARKPSAFALKRLSAAAKSGSLQATVLQLADQIAISPQRPLSKKQRAELERAAAAAQVPAQSLLGVILIDEGDHVTGRAWLTAAANAGNVAAQDSLASQFERSIEGGPPRDIEQARKWRFEAAHGGSVKSMTWLAQYYASLDRTPANRFETLGWWRSAAVASDVDAAVRLAEMLAEGGEGIERNADSARTIYSEILSNSDRADARRALALLLLDGAPGVEKDVVEARRLLRIDADKGDPRAQAVLGARMLKGSFGQTEADGAEWLDKVNDAKDAGALLEAGGILYYGHTIDRDRAAGLRAWERAHAMGIRMAGNNLAWVLCTSDVTPPLDPPKGLAIIEAMFADGKPVAPSFVDTRAACEAANGRFVDAIASQENARTQVVPLMAPESRTLKRMQARAELYRQHKVYVESGLDD